MYKKFILASVVRIFFIMCLFLTLLEKASSQSLLWKITHPELNYTSYIYGTIHITDQRVFEWKDSIFKRLEQCHNFASEIDMRMENLIKASGMMFIKNGPGIRDRFKPDDYEIIKTGLKSCSGFELESLNNIKPPALISLCFAKRKDTDLEASVDELLYNKAILLNKETIGIETVEEQIALLDKIPDSYVLEYFKNLNEQDKEMEKLIRFYNSGNLDSLLILINEEESGSLLNDEIIRNRNYIMTKRILPYLKEESIFIAIGSGHLPGIEGVLSLLRKEGFIVEPVYYREKGQGTRDKGKDSY